MKSMIFSGLLLAGVLSAQSSLPPAPRQFDVASIHPSAPLPTTPNGQMSAGVVVDRNQFRSTALALRDYICLGEKLKIYQVQGPDWIASDRFDINATIPAFPDGQALGQDALAGMMKSLITERFHMRSHRTSKLWSR